MALQRSKIYIVFGENIFSLNIDLSLFFKDWLKPFSEIYQIKNEKKVDKKIYGLKLCKILVYSLMVSILIILMIFQIVQCFLNYYAFPTYVSTGIVPQNEAQFPDITICPDSYYAYHKPRLYVSIV